MALHFTEQEWATIAHALRSAAAKYEDCRYAVNADTDGRVMVSLAEQFTRQAAEAIRLAERIEDEAGV